MRRVHSKHHLTDEQFAACLDGTPLQADSQAHLGACDKCRIEMQLFQESMTSFGAAASGWSKSQPVPSLRPVVLARPVRSAGLGLQWALAAMLLVGVGVPVLIHTEHLNNERRSQAAAEAAAASSDSDLQIAQDNAMLNSVNMALSSADPSPFQQYDLPTGPRSRSTFHAPARDQ